MTTHIVCLVVLITHGLVSGLFESTPESISPTSTQRVSLRCDPEVKNDKDVILAINIIKKQSNDNLKSTLSDTVGQTGPAESRQHQEEATTTTTTTPAIEELPRLDRLRNNNSRRRRQSDDQLVRATITAGNRTDIVPGGGRFTVTGDIDRPPYLMVNISNPSTKDIGLYECEFTVLDLSSGPKTTFEMIQIRGVVELSVDDLEQRVKVLEDERRSNTVSMQEMRKLVDGCVQANTFVREDVTALQKKTDDLFNTISELAKEMRGVSERVSSGGENQKDQSSRRGGNQYVPGDEFYKLNARIDALITNQIHALAKNLVELRDYLRGTQDRVITLELSVSGTIDKRLKTLEDIEWIGIRESLQNLELRTIPLLLMNVTQVHENVTDIKRRLLSCCGDAQQTTFDETTSSTSTPQTQILLTTTTTTEELITNYTVPACFVCGNNVTEEHCPISARNHTIACPYRQPFCITDLYQNGITRHIYKRCVSERECKEDKAKSSAQCSTDNFRKVTPMECHFCCTSILCNSDIRPPVDLY